MFIKYVNSDKVYKYWLKNKNKINIKSKNINFVMECK